MYNVLNLAGFYLKSFPMPGSHQMTSPGIAIIFIVNFPLNCFGSRLISFLLVQFR